MPGRCRAVLSLSEEEGEGVGRPGSCVLEEMVDLRRVGRGDEEEGGGVVEGWLGFEDALDRERGAVWPVGKRRRMSSGTMKG